MVIQPWQMLLGVIRYRSWNLCACMENTELQRLTAGFGVYLDVSEENLIFDFRILTSTEIPDGLLVIDKMFS